MNDREIIEQLFKLRKENNLNLTQFSRSSGYDRATIQRAEAKKVRPKLSMACDLAEALGYELVLKPKE